MDSRVGSMARLTTICATRSATVGTATANCTGPQLAFGMGGDPSPVPSDARPALRSAQKATHIGRRYSHPPRVGTRQFQRGTRMDGLGRPVCVRHARLLIAAP